MAETQESCDHAEGRDDPYDLRQRFIQQHREDFSTALAEIKQGRKQTCWSWYIFPTPPWIVGGQEMGSWTNQRVSVNSVYTPLEE